MSGRKERQYCPEHDAMAHVEAGARVLARDVVAVGGEGACPVAIAVRLAPGIVSEQAQVPADAAVPIHQDLILPEETGGFILVDIAAGGRADTEGVRHICASVERELRARCCRWRSESYSSATGVRR